MSLLLLFQQQAVVASEKYKRTITIEHGNIASPRNLVNFPLLMLFTGPALRTVANGGNVVSNSGYDIVLRIPGEANIVLDYQILKYDGERGAIIVWVKIPNLSISVDTQISLYFAHNTSVPIFSRENPTGVFSQGYVGANILGAYPKNFFPAIVTNPQSDISPSTIYASFMFNKENVNAGSSSGIAITLPLANNVIQYLAAAIRRWTKTSRPI